MLAVIVTIMTITGRFICSANSYCDNNDNNGDVYMQAVLAVIVTIMTIKWRYICSVNSYWDNNWEVYM